MTKPSHCENCEHSLPVASEETVMACWVILDYTECDSGPCGHFKEVSSASKESCGGQPSCLLPRLKTATRNLGLAVSVNAANY